MKKLSVNNLLDHHFPVTDKISENMNVIANEPSLAFFRIQEHVRKSLPQLVETKVSQRVETEVS